MFYEALPPESLPPDVPPLPPREPPPRRPVVFDAPRPRVPLALRVPVLRDEPVPADLARDVPELFAAVRPEDFFAVDVLLLPLDGLAPDRVLFARPVVERPAVLRDVLDRAPLEPELPPPLLDDVSSSLHLPDNTRCAASATASAISEPSLVADDIAVVAALDAASAASRPASRIFRRAAGLALIAAAAAARPAANISRLIAALAILSTVVLPLPLEDFVPLFLLDFAIA